ncbi:MAG TPA: hypothetical protein VFI06_03530 [Chitinophagaceae bacterium]|nr:hypothetical protein [Chitinophagaceae bacterium]
MSYENIVGIIGVGLILLAFFLNTAKFIPNNGKTYYVMNIFGAALACYASYLIAYLPFVILEGVWTIVSIYGLMKAMNVRVS